MKILGFIYLLLSLNTYGDDTIVSIQNKKNKSRIEVTCLEKNDEECLSYNLTIDKRGERNDFFIEDFKELNLEFTEAMRALQVHQLYRESYRLTRTLDRVCRVGMNADVRYSGYNDRTSCMLRLFLATTVFTSVGLAVPGAFAVVPAVEALALAGVADTVIRKNLTIAQFVLFYPAIAVDLIRLTTVYPIKKIKNSLRRKRLRKKIIPLLKNTLSKIRDFKNDGRPVIYFVKNSDFKLISNALMAKRQE